MVWLWKEMFLSNVFQTQVIWSELLKITENFKLNGKILNYVPTSLGHFTMIMNKL